MDGINWRSTNAFFAETTIAAAVADAGHPPLADITTHRKEAVCRQPFGGREGVFAADGIFLSAVGCRCLAVRLTENISVVEKPDIEC